MKIGDYVRTINGKIWIIRSQKAISGHKKDIINYSENIIDLIEVGDIIKYHQVQNNYIKTNILYKAIKNEREKIELEYDITHNKKSIISIVTKEQFESMEYKVGEDNE